MTMIDNGVQGAKRQAIKNDPMLQIIIRVAEKYPDDHLATKHAREFQQIIESHKDSIDLLNQVFEYYWVNNAKRVVKKPMTRAEKAAKSAQIKARLERKRFEVELGVQAEAQKMFLDMAMPNGKALRDCTGRELKEMEPKISKTLKFLVRTIKPTQSVGSVYNSNQALLAAAKVSK